METFYLNPTLRAEIPERESFDHVMALSGETVRQKDDRHTFRITLGDSAYFIKQHNGVGINEIFKELSTLKWPVVSALNEYRAIAHLSGLGIETMTAVGYGERGRNPANIQSFLITDEIKDTFTLEEVTDRWLAEAPAFRARIALVKELARIARAMHSGGMNHRDFYLCHFRIDRTLAAQLDTQRPVLFLMDLHRAQIRRKVPSRWLVKDIGALYFSAAHLPINRRDLLRFMRDYSGKSLRQTLREDSGFWRRVERRARKFYLRQWGRPMPVLLPRGE